MDENKQILRSDFKEILPTKGRSPCFIFFVSFIEFINVLIKWFKWAFNESGIITDEFRNLFCDIKCTDNNNTTVPSCPELTLSIDMYAPDNGDSTKAIVKIRGNLTPQYSLSIFKKKSTDSDFTDVLLSYQITDRETVLEIGNLELNETYTFKFLFVRQNCPDVIRLINYINNPCYNRQVMYNVVANYDDTTKTVKIEAKPDEGGSRGFIVGSNYQIYKTDSIFGYTYGNGQLLVDDTVKEDSCSPYNDGRKGICYTETDVVSFKDITYYYIVGVKADNNCSYVYKISNPVNVPALVIPPPTYVQILPYNNERTVRGTLSVQRIPYEMLILSPPPAFHFIMVCQHMQEPKYAIQAVITKVKAFDNANKMVIYEGSFESQTEKQHIYVDLNQHATSKLYPYLSATRGPKTVSIIVEFEYYYKLNVGNIITESKTLPVTKLLFHYTGNV